MDFYYALKGLDDEQVKELISFKIDELSYKASINRKDFVGINCGVNPYITLSEEKEESKPMWFGYIPENVKLVYRYEESRNCSVNNGGYYYMDDSIIYEFALFIKNKKVDNYLDFLDLIWEFVAAYFNSFGFPSNNRDQMLTPILRDEEWYFEPTFKHCITNFKGRSNAMCTEFTAVVQNILSVFGYQTLFFIGSVKCDYGEGAHAFNIAFIDNHPLLLDYTIPVRTYDLHKQLVSYSPYIGIIKNYNDQTLANSYKQSEPLDFPEYDFFLLGDNVQYHGKDSRRYYALSDIKFFKEHPNYVKKIKGLIK